MITSSLDNSGGDIDSPRANSQGRAPTAVPSLAERLDALAEKYGMMYDDLDLMGEAIALARRVEAAPKVRVRGKIGEVCMIPVSHDFCGKRVRLVVCEEGGADGNS